MTLLRTGIKSNIAVTDPTGLPLLTNWRDTITAASSFVGLWKFDDESLLVRSSGKVAQIKNWKVGGPSMVQATSGNQPATFVDGTVNRAVGVFTTTAHEHLGISGYTFDAKLPWTIVVVAKPSTYASQGQIAGASDAGNTRANIVTTQTLAPAPVFRINYGSSATGQGIVSAGAWHRAIAAYDGSSLIPKILVDDQTRVDGAAASAEPTITDIFRISSASISFPGSIDLVALFSASLFDGSHDTLLEAVQGYLTARGV